MSSNPYAPPLAKVEDTPDQMGRGTPQFFAVAPWKMMLMMFATLGLYQVFWLYQHWRIVKARDRSEIWPVPRAIFAIFFCYSLFKRVRDDGQALQLAGPPAAGPLATLWIIASLAWRLPGAMGFLGMVAWIVGLPIQVYANRINAKVAPHAPRNDRLTWLNWIMIGIAAILWALVAVGAMLPEDK